MDESIVQVALFRAFASAILDMNISPEEARVAAQVLRRGDVNIQLAAFVDGLVPLSNKEIQKVQERNRNYKTHSSNVKIKSVEYDVDSLFDTVKRRKITKSQLWSLFYQVNREVSDVIDYGLSMKDGIGAFRSMASKDDWDLLSDIIQSGSNVDPFLAGITGR